MSLGSACPKQLSIASAYVDVFALQRVGSLTQDFVAAARSSRVHERVPDCVAALAPKRVVPTVNCHSEAAVAAQLKLLLPHRGSAKLLQLD